ncbi:hypothetical protein HDK90DRAFT_322655 [Phyllosticta capitalensis]|uniref:Uncharacterized protein n=1 Tax=Phyllosticta capitalensis TaxID=121624 RepID=A0ABR1YJI8_9PEZI
MFNIRAIISRIFHHDSRPSREPAEVSIPLIQLIERQLEAKDKCIDSLKSELFELRTRMQLRQISTEVLDTTAMSVDSTEDELQNDHMEEVDLVQAPQDNAQAESYSEANLESDSPDGYAGPSSPPRLPEANYADFRSVPSSRTVGRSDVFPPPSSTVGFNDFITRSSTLTSSRTSQPKTTQIIPGKRPHDAACKDDLDLDRDRPVNKTIKRLRDGNDSFQLKTPTAFTRRTLWSPPDVISSGNEAPTPFKTPENRLLAVNMAPPAKPKPQHKCGKWRQISSSGGDRPVEI